MLLNTLDLFNFLQKNSLSPRARKKSVRYHHALTHYTTPVLDCGIEVTGPIRAVLYVSSSAKDTDFTAKLVDVYPDGFACNIHEGILRARYREGFGKKVWIILPIIP